MNHQSDLTPLANAIYKIVKENRGGVSFVELQHLPGFKGEYEWYLELFNVVMWQGLSREAIDAFQELRARNLIHPYPTTVLVYLCDGAVPKMPLATRVHHYKEPHWMPVVFNLGPHPKTKHARKTKKRFSAVK
jgi:hypothetical protein